MKRLFFFGMILFLMGFAGSGFAQTAAQYVGAGNQSYAAKDYAKGAQYYQAAVQLDPNSAAAYQGLGNCQYMLGKNAEALAAYEKASSLDPNNTQLSSFVQTLRAKVGSSTVAVPTPAPSGSSVSPSSGSAKSFELDFGGGVAMGSSGYDLGFGGGAAGYLLMPGGLGIGGSVGFYTFSNTTTLPLGPIGTGSVSNSWTNIEILASGKYTFEGSGIKPYLKGGAGLDMFGISSSISYSLNPPYNVPPYTTIYQSISIPGGSSMYPMIQAGGGVQFSMGTDMSFFAEAKYNLIIGNGGTTSYIPIGVGLALNI